MMLYVTHSRIKNIKELLHKGSPLQLHGQPKSIFKFVSKTWPILFHYFDNTTTTKPLNSNELFPVTSKEELGKLNNKTYFN